MVGQNTSEIWLSNDADIITRMKLPNMCPFEERNFLTWINLTPGFGRNYDTFLKTFTNGTC